jgi:7,8-dihydroneopterin aldolase/epimerase/oxygenase
MQNIIRLKKVSFYAYHGVFQQEKDMGGKFEADIDIYTDFSHAALKDKLGSTIDYEKVYKTIIGISESKKYFLIETLAVKVVDEIFSGFPSIQQIAIRIRKNNPPIGGLVDSVEVEVVKTREEYLSQLPNNSQS